MSKQIKAKPMLKLTEEIDRRIADFESSMKSLKELFDRDLLSAVEHHTESYAKLVQITAHLKLLQSLIAKHDDKTELEAVQYAIRSMKDSLMEWSPKKSTNPIANTVHAAKREGDKEFLSLLHYFEAIAKGMI